jgi:hypothetical protein
VPAENKVNSNKGDVLRRELQIRKKDPEICLKARLQGECDRKMKRRAATPLSEKVYRSAVVCR